MPYIEVDQETDEAIAFAAYIAGLATGRDVTKTEVVAQLIRGARPPRTAEPAATLAASTTATASAATETVELDAFYEGHRTTAVYFTVGGRIQITNGPLAGQIFKTPSEAAKAVVGLYNPEVKANRNGWTFWRVADTGQPLNSLRKETAYARRPRRGIEAADGLSPATIAAASFAGSGGTHGVSGSHSDSLAEPEATSGTSRGR